MRADRFINSVTALVLAYNEEANIERCLERLTWARKVIVIDSGSTDATLAICARFLNVTVVHRAFDSAAQQGNFGLSISDTEWILSMDSDYILPEDFVSKLHVDWDRIDGVSFNFKYAVFGKNLRGTLYPPRTMLYRRAKAKYYNDGHTQRVAIDGTVVRAEGVCVVHDDRKSLGRWLTSQRRYVGLEADKILNHTGRLSFSDRLRNLIWPAPILVFFYTYFFKGCFLDGWAGIYYTFQRIYAELLLSLELLARRLRK